MERREATPEVLASPVVLSKPAPRSRQNWTPHDRDANARVTNRDHFRSNVVKQNSEWMFFALASPQLLATILSNSYSQGKTIDSCPMWFSQGCNTNFSRRRIYTILRIVPHQQFGGKTIKPHFGFFLSHGLLQHSHNVLCHITRNSWAQHQPKVPYFIHFAEYYDAVRLPPLCWLLTSRVNETDMILHHGSRGPNTR